MYKNNPSFRNNVEINQKYIPIFQLLVDMNKSNNKKKQETIWKFFLRYHFPSFFNGRGKVISMMNSTAEVAKVFFKGYPSYEQNFYCDNCNLKLKHSPLMSVQVKDLKNIKSLFEEERILQRKCKTNECKNIIKRPFKYSNMLLFETKIQAPSEDLRNISCDLISFEDIPKSFECGGNIYYFHFVTRYLPPYYPNFIGHFVNYTVAKSRVFLFNDDPYEAREVSVEKLKFIPSVLVYSIFPPNA